MTAVKDVALWTVGELRMLWGVIRMLLEILVTWLQFKFIPPMRRRFLAPYECALQSFTNWQVRSSRVAVVNRCD